MLALLALLGFPVGLLSSFFGVGGGVIMVPILYLAFPMIPAPTVIGSSLGVIFVNSCLNTRNFLKMDRVPELNVCLAMGMGITIGALIGGQLALITPQHYLKMGFGILLLVIAVRTLIIPSGIAQRRNWRPTASTATLIKIALGAFLGGMVAGMSGLGGGVILVPLMITLLRAPFDWIPVYNNVAMGLGALSGALMYMSRITPAWRVPHPLIMQFQVGHVNFALILLIILGAIPASKLGTRLTQKVPAQVARGLFAALLCIFSLRILITSY